MKKIFKILFVLGLPFFVTVKGFAATEAETRKVIEALEQRILELEQHRQIIDDWRTEFYVQSVNRVTPFLGEKISFGGFFETGITSLSGPDTQTQTSANSHTLGVNISAEFNENVRFVTQFITGLSYNVQNIHNNPALTPSRRQIGAVGVGTLVAQGYVEIVKSSAFIIQTGLGYAPFGVAFQLREPVLFRRRIGPQMVGAADANSVGIAFPLWMGLHAHGAFSTKSGSWGYNAYTFSPTTNAKTLGLGSRLWLRSAENVTAGVSMQYGQRASDLFYSYGVDLDMKYDRMGLTVEFGRTEFSNGTRSPYSGYIEPYMDFADGKIIGYLMADYLDNPSRLVGAVDDSFQRWQYGGGVNWLPVSNVRYRAGISDYEYVGDRAVISGQRRQFGQLDLSVGIAF